MLDRSIRFSLYNRLIVLVVSAIVLIVGSLLLINTEVDIFPDLNAPTVTVMTEAPGLATEEVERLVTYPIEVAVNGARGVDNVRSSSTTGFSVVNVIFTDDTDPLVARQTVTERLSQVTGQLPDAAGTPVIGPQSSILGEILIIGLSSDSLSLAQTRTIADRILKPALLGVSGVSSVAVIGGDELEYQIFLDQGLMKHFGLSLDEVSEPLSQMNANSIGNVINSYGNEYVVKGDVSTTSVDDLAATVIRSDEAGVVTLGDIARVTTGAREPHLGSASVKGRPSVILTVTKQPGVGTINLTERLLSEIDNQKKSLPPSLVISTDIFSQRDFIDSSISNLSSSLFEGALMVIIVLFFFMMNMRATLVSLIALPMSIIITVIILHLMDLTINTMSLGGIAIAIGSLVDDAIVDVENVNKRLRHAMAVRKAEGGSLSTKETLNIVYEASREVRTPIFNSSLIIVAGFMPLFFLNGMEGRMLIPLGISFIVALAASTVVALTVTPAVCSYLLPSGVARKLARVNSEESADPRLVRHLRNSYRKGVTAALSHKAAWIGGIVVLFAIAAVMATTLGRGFLPSFNEGSFTINISALPGISLDESDKVGQMAEEIIMSVPEIKTVARKTGRAELDEHSLGTNVSEIEAPYTQGGRSRAEIANELRDKLSVIPGVNIEIGQPISHRIDAMLSGTEAPIVFKVYGTDLDMLNRIAGQIKGIMAATPHLADVAVEQQIDRPEISITPRRALMARYGVTPAQFNRVVETALAGQVVSSVYTDGYPLDLRLKIDPADGSLSGIDAISEVMVDTQVGKIPLSEIADIREVTGPNTVNRENTSRRIVISANIEGGDVQTAVTHINREIAENVQLPDGYTVVEAGQASSASAASLRLLWASLLAILVIFALLYYEFHNLRQSAVILINMPLAVTGGILILFFTGGHLDIPAIIGIIALLGIATRNGMLLISRYNSLVAAGASVRDAIIEGSADRLAPIIMTALTSALALIPLALRGGQPGNEIQSPLAIVILGGLASSTILNLFITPILYQLTYKKNK